MSNGTDARCRFCSTSLAHTFCDLGMSPLSNAYLRTEHLKQMEPFYPLHAYVCESCKLVQLEQFETPENIFSDYPYFSSYSESWLKHAERYTKDMTERFGLNGDSRVIEIASNDGYLLQYFKARRIPVLGVEPAANVARVAEQERGIPTRVAFFGRATAAQLVAEGLHADLLLGNNVLAHVPDLNDFVAGMKPVLKPNGVVTMEFPHLLRLMQSNQFDTIYHEHFSYLSLLVVEGVFQHHGLRLFDVEQLSTHGGSLRVFACHSENTQHVDRGSVARLIEQERAAGLDSLAAYSAFNEQARMVKRDLLDLLIGMKRKGKRIVGYGAAAKGNTLLNYCGIRSDILDYVVDRSPHKQGRFLPGTRLPIVAPEQIARTRPDYVLILPWNLRQEIVDQMSYIKQWGGRFVVPIPMPEVIVP